MAVVTARLFNVAVPDTPSGADPTLVVPSKNTTVPVGVPPVPVTVAVSVTVPLIDVEVGDTVIVVVDCTPVLGVTLTVTIDEVDAGYVALPTNVALTEFEPTVSNAPGTDSEQPPPLIVQLPSVVEPAVKFTVPLSAGGLLKPVGAVPDTVAVRVVDWLVVIDVGEAVSPVVLVNALFQFVIRFATFSVPMPVAAS